MDHSEEPKPPAGRSGSRLSCLCRQQTQLTPQLKNDGMVFAVQGQGRWLQYDEIVGKALSAASNHPFLLSNRFSGMKPAGLNTLGCLCSPDAASDVQ